jgi:hypothetical protein
MIQYPSDVARLKNLQTGEAFPLAARTVIGRSAACNLRLASPLASGEHASIAWVDDGWELRDLASRNGTFAGGERLAGGGAVRLRPGLRIAFGEPEEAWALEEALPPGLFAVELSTREVVQSESGLLALPDDERPAFLIYLSPDGWVAETPDGELRPLSDATVLTGAGGAWEVRLPDRYAPTVPAGGPTIDDVELRMMVSRDEEHVQITVVHRRGEIALEPREHGYLLLTLARARLSDAGLPEVERGWRDRDEIVRMLATDVNALNVAIFRARQQLAAAGVEGAGRLVEVRRGQRRIGVARLRVDRLGD